MDQNSILEFFKAISGNGSTSDQQSSAPVPPASAGSGAGSMYGALNAKPNPSPTGQPISPALAQALSSAFGNK